MANSELEEHVLAFDKNNLEKWIDKSMVDEANEWALGRYLIEQRNHLLSFLNHYAKLI